MVQNGLYVIKKEFIDIITSLGGIYDVNFGDKRPVFCCFKDNKINGLYWAIPTSDLSHRTDTQKQRYNECMSKPKNDLRWAYYHIANTDKKALYKISSCFPITDKYIDHEYVTNNVHVIMKRSDDIKALNLKLRKILSFENRKNNYFPQRITDIKNYLIKELNDEKETA
ncbi:MAG: hypothetical protein KBT35_05925 [Firmicutes bacterium]|nr:hypothetical protein [Candidatus Colivicinus equi]